MLLSSDSSIGISKSMGLAQIGFAEAYEELNPDMVIVLGDRYEIFSAASAAMIACIPIAHLHGGETTEGAFDESIRHSITKMSHLHFTATQEYKNRVIQLGEHPNRVFNVGGMGIENIKRLKLLGKKEFEESIDFKLNDKNILVTFHPVTLEKSTAKEQFQELLNAIDMLEDTSIIFTKANSDTDGRTINQMIDEYVSQNSEKSIAFTSLGQLRYLSALQYVDAVVGNSSSGLLEAPSFKIGTINIGDRQKGRIKASSVIDCEPNKGSIQQAFTALYSQELQETLKTTENLYGDGCASKKIVEILETVDLEDILKKSFHDARQKKNTFDKQARTNSLVGYFSHDNLFYAGNYENSYNLLYFSDKYIDQIIHPLLFNLRQFLEIILKECIIKLSKYSKSNNLLKDIYATHDFEKLSNSFYEHYKKAKPEIFKEYKDKEYLQNLGKLMKFYISLDNTSMSFRYSKDKRKKEHFTIDKKINAEQLHCYYLGAKDFLWGICGVVDEMEKSAW